MKRWLRGLAYFLLILVLLVALCGALFGYYLYTPDPVRPQLSGTLSRATLQVGGLQRSYLTYVPRGLPRGAPLVLVMHGSGEGAEDIRIGTGYGFERLADQHGFAVAYPNSASFDWNDCSKVGDFNVNGQPADDMAFLGALVERLVADTGADPRRVFATGVSAGGFMALRLALEAPARFRAVAAVSANVPAPENFKCTAAGNGTSVMLMNGTADPLVPFHGGEVNLLGLFFKNGNVRSAQQSAQYFADLNQIAGAPAVSQSAGYGVTQFDGHNGAGATVQLVTIDGGGHGMPQPDWRRPRLLGPSPMAPNGPALIWDFFARQQNRALP